MEEEKYKRYMVFGHEYYYPAGSLNDVVGSADELSEAIDIYNAQTITTKNGTFDLWEEKVIFDRIEGVVVMRYSASTPPLPE